MKPIISGLNKEFENRVRLGIMSMLMVNERMDFKSLKSMLGVTDGNLASHLNSLEKKQFIEMKKQFIGRKPNTSYKATVKGRKAFQKHLDALDNLLQHQR